MKKLLKPIHILQYLLGLFLITMALGALSGAMSEAWWLHMSAWLGPLGTFVVFFFVQHVFMLGTLFAVGRRPSRSRWKNLGRKAAAKRIFGAFVLYILLMALLGYIVEVFQLTIPGFNGEQDVFHEVSSLMSGPWWQVVTMFMLVVFVGPLLEEIVFRAFITEVLMKSRGLSGVFVASLLFALIHLERQVIWNMIILACFLGYIYRRTGSLRYSLGFHILINGLAMLALIFGVV